MAGFEERYYRSRDGLKLYYRDYHGDPGRAPVLCLAGLTRNCRDFQRLAAHIAPGRAVITPDLRGRGRSQHDPNWLNYHPLTYLNDIWLLLRELSVERVIVIGTSLGGLIAMLMAAARAQALAGVVLNDIGPRLDPAGARRIYNYVGHLPEVDNWDQAVAQMKRAFAVALPDLTEQRWREFAQATFFADAAGVPRLALDPQIGKLLRLVPPGAAPGMWLAHGALRSVKTMAIRGALSDLLSEKTFERMQRDKPDLIHVSVPNRGHAPLLDEPECLQAIDQFLDGIKE